MVTTDDKIEYAQVLYDYDAKFADELTIRSGDLVQILYKIDENWLYAKSLMFSFTDTINNKSGIIPNNYVEFLSNLPDLIDQIDLNACQIYVANSNFDTNLEPGDLETKKNDLLISIEQIDSNWLYGYNLKNNNQYGIFPLTHVNQVYIENKANHANSIILNDNNDLSSSLPKQAKVLYDFKTTTDNEYYNDELKYLDLTQNDFVLITDKLNSDWYIGENYTGEKGIIPVQYVEILNDSITRSHSILNRTQRLNYMTNNVEQSYLNDEVPLSPEVDYSTDDLQKAEIEDSIKNDAITTTTRPIYCRLNYDFRAENENELTSSYGEYVKIIDEYYSQDWIKCMNSSNKIGLVPLSYVTLVHGPDETELARQTFEKEPENNQIITKNIDNYQEEDDDDFEDDIPVTNPTESNDFRLKFRNELNNLISTAHSAEIQHENNDLNLKVTNPFRTVEHHNITKEEKVKPPIPPKPKRESLPNMIRQPPPPPSPKQSIIFDTNQDKLEKRKIERILSIKELIETEKNYCNELSLCYDLFMNDQNTPVEFNKNLLFDKLLQIVQISTNLIKSFEMETKCNEKTEEINENAKIGLCLIQLANEMKVTNAYAQYARGHNEVAILVKKYEANPILNGYIQSRLDSIRDQIRVASLSTILIKPVQRIFKYPLFINRLLQNTDETHLDYSNLKEASRIFTETLEFINEYKRRKDLVTKYLSTIEQNESISELMKKINIKSIKKKSNRISLQISNALGLFCPQVTDEKFNQEEAVFRMIEKTVRIVYYDIDVYLNSLRDLLDCEKNLFDDLLKMFIDEFQTFSKMDQFSNATRSIEFQKLVNKIMPNVLTPLNTLINIYSGPNKLIEKRSDKLLDYEGALSDLELKKTNNIGPSTKELANHVEKTKKDYDALNVQLLEELPILNKKSSQILKKCVQYFIKANSDFLNLLNVGFFDIIKNCKFEHYNLSETQKANLMIKLNNLNLSYQNRQISLLTSNSDSNISFISNASVSFRVNNPSNASSNQSEEQRKKLIKKYPVEKLYVVKQNYVANEKLCQLQQSINDLVGLKIAHDPSNQKNIWFVDNGEMEGFIPSQALEQYKDPNRNLIDFETKLSQNGQLVAAAQTSRPPSYDLNILINENNFDLNSSQELYCIALYDFKAIASNMIDLVDGEICKVIEKHDKKNDPEWWLIEKNNVRGYVPRNYVKLLD